MLKTISATKKDLRDTHPATHYFNNCLRAEGMRDNFKNWHNDDFIQLDDKQRRSINLWIDSIMMS